MSTSTTTATPVKKRQTNRKEASFPIHSPGLQTLSSSQAQSRKKSFHELNKLKMDKNTQHETSKVKSKAESVKSTSSSDSKPVEIRRTDMKKTSSPICCPPGSQPPQSSPAQSHNKSIQELKKLKMDETMVPGTSKDSKKRKFEEESVKSTSSSDSKPVEIRRTDMKETSSPICCPPGSQPPQSSPAQSHNKSIQELKKLKMDKNTQHETSKVKSKAESVKSTSSSDSKPVEIRRTDMKETSSPICCPLGSQPPQSSPAQSHNKSIQELKKLKFPQSLPRGLKRPHEGEQSLPSTSTDVPPPQSPPRMLIRGLKKPQIDTKQEKKQDSYTTYMSLNSILRNDDENCIKNKIEHDVENASRIKILTAIFINFIMNKPECQLSKEFAICGFNHYRVMNCFKKRKVEDYISCKKKDPELYTLLEEFKLAMADEESEIDPVLFDEFIKNSEKENQVYENKEEQLKQYNKFRIEKLTNINCQYQTNLLLQAAREMDKDFRVHLHMEGPKILKKYLKFKEFGVQTKEEVDKQDTSVKNEKTEDIKEKEKRAKKNKRRLENFERKVEKRKKENKKLKEERREVTAEEVKETHKNNKKIAREEANKVYTKTICKNREEEKVKILRKKNEKMDKEEAEKNQQARIEQKNTQIKERKEKGRNVVKITFKKNGIKQSLTKEEIKEKEKKVEKALDNLLFYNRCTDEKLCSYLEEIKRETEEIDIRLEKKMDEKEKNEKGKGKGKKQKMKKEKEEVQLLDFLDLDNEYECCKFLPLYMRIQREFVDNGLKGFVLFPMRRFGLQHVTLTQTILEKDFLPYLNTLSKKKVVEVSEMKQKLNEQDEKNKIKNTTKRENAKKGKNALEKKFDKLKILWQGMFDLKKVTKNKKKRECSVPRAMQTDGVKVSLIYNLKKAEKIKSSSNKRKKKNNYDRLVGLDPGLKAMFGGAVRDGDPHVKIDQTSKKISKTQDTPIYVNAKTFRFRAGEYRRKKMLHKYSKNIEERFDSFLKKNVKYNNVEKRDPRKYLLLAKFNFKQFEIKQAALTRKCFRNLRFNKLISVQRETDRLVNFIMGDVKKKPCLVAIGTTSISPCMKGHVKTPVQRIERRLRERSKQVGEEKLKIVHCYEGNTTKFCSSCNQQNVVSRSPKRYAFCQKCHVVWNRDVNAGINILNIALINEDILTGENIPNAKVFKGIKSVKDM